MARLTAGASGGGIPQKMPTGYTLPPPVAPAAATWKPTDPAAMNAAVWAPTDPSAVIGRAPTTAAADAAAPCAAAAAAGGNKGTGYKNGRALQILPATSPSDFQTLLSQSFGISIT